MTTEQIEQLIAETGADGIADMIQYLVDKGVITTRQKIAADRNMSRGWIENRMRLNTYRNIHIYKYATLIVDHERITNDTEPTASSQESTK